MKELDYLHPGLTASGEFDLAPSIEGFPNVGVGDSDTSIFRIIVSDFVKGEVPLPRSCAIIGTPGETVAKFVPGSYRNPFVRYGMSNRVYPDGEWAEAIYIYGVTFDCGWDRFEEQRRKNNFNTKIGGVSLFGKHIKIEKCRFINWGAEGTSGTTFNEVFPCILKTWRGHDTAIEIKDCVFEEPNYENGGYATAAMVVTNHQADRLIQRLDRVVAHIHGCRFNIPPNGIALGCGGAHGSENVLFENNVVEQAKCAVNVDTGKIHGLTIRNNIFRGCNQGVNVTSPNEEVSIVGNVIELTEPFQNPVTWEAEWFLAGRFKNNSNTTFDRNLLIDNSGLFGSSAADWLEGDYDGENDGFSEDLSQPDQELSTDHADTIAALRKQAAERISQLDALRRGRIDDDRTIRDLREQASANIERMEALLKERVSLRSTLEKIIEGLAKL